MYENTMSHGKPCTSQFALERLPGAPKRLGILGGSFNPVTQGHIYLAKLAMQRFDLRQVMLLPCGDPPHKSQDELAPAHHRLVMAQLATQELPGLICSDMEIRRKGKTYTVDTLEILTQALPGTRLHYIIGTDTLLDLWSWRNVARVVQLCVLLVFMRPGDDRARVLDAAEELRVELGADVQLFEDLGLDVSASRVRAYLAQGKCIDGMVPRSVQRYMRRHGLYGAAWQEGE